MNLLFSIPAIIWLVLSAFCYAFGEFLSKKFALNPSWFYILSLLGMYILGTLAWLPAILQKSELSITGTLWNVLALFATVLIGIIIFGEQVNMFGILGIAFAIIAVILLSLA